MFPAKTVIQKCGGARQTAHLAGCSVGHVYKWVTKTDGGGYGGRIPDAPRRRLLAAALAGVVDLTPADFELGWSE